MEPYSDPWSPPDDFGYSWLLGYYLGDGCVARGTRTFQLRVVLDGRYPDVVDDCVTAVLMVVPNSQVHVRPRKHDCGVIVEASSTSWPQIFPQHGPGRKHTRPIVLTKWQRRISVAHRTSVALLDSFVGPKS